MERDVRSIAHFDQKQERMVRVDLGAFHEDAIGDADHVA